MHSDELEVGMTLYCDDGFSEVRLCEILEDTIIVLYKGKRYPRPRSIIGVRLFTKPVAPKGLTAVKTSTPATQEAGVSEKSSGQREREVTTISITPIYDATGYDNQGYNHLGFDKEGFDRSGFNIFGYDREGYNHHGFDKEGFDRSGFNMFGYDRNGFDYDGFDENGYDVYGYNRKGYDKNGFNRQGFDISGYNAAGFDKNGFDRNGYDTEGYNREGYNREGYNRFDLNVKMEFRPGSIIQNLKPDVSKLYHFAYGEGVLRSVNVKPQGVYLSVNFDFGTKTFVYPSCFSKGHLQITKTDEMNNFEEFLNTPSGRLIFEEESDFLGSIFELIQTDVALAESNYEESRYALYGVEDDAWTQSLSSKLKAAYADAHRIKFKLYSVRRSPYFARVDVGGIRHYIGKNEYRDIIEWTDPRASMYYEYQMYIGNDKYRLTLVRDLRIYLNTICSISDKYNVRSEAKENQFDAPDGVISDPNLLMIINANRENKAVHDIISTIQRNQYRIITSDLKENIMVFGCAGSGKTMIMLHRLRYLLRNNKDISPKNIMVLSPTDALTSENSQLASLLGMNDIGVFSNHSLYSFIIQNICRELGCEYTNQNKIYQSNDHIEGNLLKSVYSSQTLRFLYEEVQKIIQEPKAREAFLHISFEEIRRKKIDFLGLSYDAAKEEKLFSDLETALQCFLDFKKIVKNYSIKNIEAFIKHNKITTKSEESLRGELRSKALEFLLTHRELLSDVTCYKIEKKNDNEKKKITTEIQDDSDKMMSLYDFLETIRWDTDESFCGTEDPIDMFENYYLPLAKYRKRLIAFENGNEYACMLDILHYVLTVYKQANDLRGYQYYEWELFVQVFVLSKFSQFTFGERTLLLVDEFQDYSLSELRILDKLFPNAVFNYFGDHEQAISAKSASKQVMSHYFETKPTITYSIFENYRNAREITAYVNSEMNMNMRPVGISGCVDIVNFDAISKINIDPDDRVVLICKKEYAEKLNDRICCTLNLECHLILNQNDTFQRGQINILPLTFAKGLEFEKVIAVIDGMSFNERYVTFTRALRELYVLKMSVV